MVLVQTEASPNAEVVPMDVDVDESQTRHIGRGIHIHVQVHHRHGHGKKKRKRKLLAFEKLSSYRIIYMDEIIKNLNRYFPVKFLRQFDLFDQR